MPDNSKTWLFVIACVALAAAALAVFGLPPGVHVPCLRVPTATDPDVIVTMLPAGFEPTGQFFAATEYYVYAVGTYHGKPAYARDNVVSVFETATTITAERP